MGQEMFAFLCIRTRIIYIFEDPKLRKPRKKSEQLDGEDDVGSQTSDYEREVCL